MATTLRKASVTCARKEAVMTPFAEWGFLGFEGTENPSPQTTHE